MSKPKNPRLVWSGDASADEVLQDMRDMRDALLQYPASEYRETPPMLPAVFYNALQTGLGASVVRGPAAEVSPFAQAGVAPEKTGGGGCPYAPIKKVVDK